MVQKPSRIVKHIISYRFPPVSPVGKIIKPLFSFNNFSKQVPFNPSNQHSYTQHPPYIIARPSPIDFCFSYKMFESITQFNRRIC